MTTRNEVENFLKTKIESPFVAGAMAVLRSEEDCAKYRGEEFRYVSYWYECEASGEKFTTDETDAASSGQVYDQYRELHSIPSVEELKALRKQCKLSATKMSALLGLGTNQYRLYEDGEMPSLSIGKLLYTLCHSAATLEFYLTQFLNPPVKYNFEDAVPQSFVADEG